MATYITLIRFTEKGLESIKEHPSRLNKARRLIMEAGGAMQAFYLTLGSYDSIVITEAPDDATYAKITLSLASKGNVQTETLKAFSHEDYRKIVEDMG